MNTAERAILRWRFLILAVWSVAWFVPQYQHFAHVPTDWNVIEYAARSVVHFNPHYPDGLHLYARDPEVQIGPPTVFLVAAFQWASPTAVALGFGIVMALAAVAVIAACERIAPEKGVGPATGSDDLWRQRMTLGAGLLVCALWSHELGKWRHLDDIMAIGLTVAALAVISRRTRHDCWLAALLIGTAVAAKPWALGAAPVLAALPRERRAPAALLTLATIGIWYAPFVLADHSTVSALNGYRLYLDPRSSLHDLGVHSVLAPSWLRNVQIGGALIGGFVLAARGRWLAIPFMAFATRVVLDPQIWPYYGLGPLVGALVLDLSSRRRLPLWTATTAIVEFLVRWSWIGESGVVRIVWFVVAMAVLFGPKRLTLGLPPWQRPTTSRTA